MNAAWIPFWATVIVATIGAIPILLRLRGEWRKDRIDMMTHMSERIDALEMDREDDRAYIGDLVAHIDRLEAIVRASNPGAVIPTRPVRRSKVTV